MRISFGVKGKSEGSFGLKDCAGETPVFKQKCKKLSVWPRDFKKLRFKKSEKVVFQNWSFL